MNSSNSHNEGDGAPRGHSVVRGTAIVGSLTLASRLFGFLRDILLAGLFGAGIRADAFFVAFRIPNLLRSLLAEGALTSAFVPTFTDELQGGKDRAQNLLHSATTLLLLISGVISIVGIFWSGQVVRIFAPGFADRPEQFELATELLQIMFGYIISVSFVALVNAALNVFQIFGYNALAQIVVNLALIGGALLAWFFSEESQVFVVAWAVMVGAVAQMAVQLFGLRKAGLHVRLVSTLWSKPIRNMLFLMLPAVFGTAVYQVVQFMNTVLASMLIPGSVTWLFYADRLSQLPLGIFTVALGSVLLPQLALLSSSGKQEQFARELENALRFVSFLLLPLSAALFFSAADFVDLVFHRGAFLSSDVVMTALALQAQVLGIWAVSAHSLFVRAFLARKQPAIPACIASVNLVLHLVIALGVVGELSNDGGIVARFFTSLQSILYPSGGYSFGHIGLALSMSLGACASLFLAWGTMRYQVADFSGKRFVRGTVSSLAIAVVGGIAASFASGLIEGVFARLSVFP